MKVNKIFTPEIVSMNIQPDFKKNINITKKKQQRCGI